MRSYAAVSARRVASTPNRMWRNDEIYEGSYRIISCHLSSHHRLQQKDNTEYKPVDTENLKCTLFDVKTRSVQFDQGVMTPLDGKFTKMTCSIVHKKNQSKEKGNRDS